DHAVLAVLNDHVAFGDVTVDVFVIHFPQRRPATDIAPACSERYDAGALGFFHDRVIDGIVRAAGEGGFVDGDRVGILFAALKGQQAGVVDVRIVFFQLFQEAAGTEQEHAAVPEVTAGLDELGGAFDVRFFNEVRDAADAFRQQRVVGRLDVAVAGFRFGGRDAEQHHFAVFGGDSGQGQGALQGFLVFQYVVGWQHQHQLVTTFIDQHHRGQGNGRRGVATERFHQD